MLLKLVTPPTVDPVTLDEAKSFLRVEHTFEDATITRLIRAATSACQSQARISFLAQTWEATYQLPAISRLSPSPRYPYAQSALGLSGSLGLALQGAYPQGVDDPDEINGGANLPFGPVASVTSATLGSDSGTFVVSSPNYTVNGSRVIWKDSFRDLLDGYNTVAIRYVAGFANKGAMDASPAGAALQTAVLMTVAMIYEHRGISEVAVPPAAQRLLNNFWDSPTY